MSLFDVLSPRLVELGKIKIGGLGEVRQKQGGGTYRQPRKDDNFTITTLQRDAKGDLIPDQLVMDQLLEKYGESGKLYRIPIYLLSNDLEDSLRSRWVYYVGRKCVASGDGLTVEWYYDQTGKHLAEPIVQEFDLDEIKKPDKNGKPRFKLHSTFSCVIGVGEGRWGGVYLFRTTSEISGNQLLGSLAQIQMLTGGQVAGVPLMLVVRPMQVSPEGKPTTVHVVHVEIRGSDMLAIQNQAKQAAELRLGNATQIRLIENQYKKLLALPGGESPDEIAELQSEFNPDASEELPAEPEAGRASALAEKLKKSRKTAETTTASTAQQAVTTVTVDLPDQGQFEGEEPQQEKLEPTKAETPDPKPEKPKVEAPKPEAKPEPKPEPKVETKTEPAPETKQEPKPEVKQDAPVGKLDTDSWTSGEAVPDEAVSSWTVFGRNITAMLTGDYDAEFITAFIAKVKVGWPVFNERLKERTTRKKFLHLLAKGDIEIQDAIGKPDGRPIA